jgi:hypothetical protein
MSYNSSWPRTEALDIDDQSVPPSLPQKRSSPIHCPLMFIRAAAGPHGGDDIIPVTSITTAKEILGADTFDPRKPYFNHQTAMLLQILAEGNTTFVKRITAIRPAANGLPRLQPDFSEFILGIEVTEVATAVKPYSLDASGLPMRGTNGFVRDVNSSISLANTLKLKLVSMSPNAYRNANLYDPIHTFVSGTQDIESTIYPIFKLSASSAGVHGDKKGFRLWSANSLSRNPTDPEVVADQSALTYRIQLVEKTATGIVSVVRDLLGGGEAEFSFKPNMFNFKTDKTLSLRNAIKQWNDDGVNNYTTQRLGPVGQGVAFNRAARSSLSALAIRLREAEHAIIAANPGIYSPLVDDATDDEYLIDFLSGVSYDGYPYQSFVVDKTSPGALDFTRNRTYYLKDGADGDLSDVAYDDTVAAQAAVTANLGSPFADSAKYPFTDIYDSGFTINTKKALMEWHDVRNDVKITVGTAVAGAGQLTPSEELSVGLVLEAEASQYAESETWGTPTCRIVIIGQSGVLSTGEYEERVPLTFERAVKRARYMGADNGVLKGDFKYDEYPLSQVQTLQYISSPNMTSLLKSKLWDSGIDYCQTFDEEKMFYAGMHTVYPEQRSVLTGDVYVAICCDVKRQSEKVWKILSNNSTLTPAQFIDESNRLLRKFTDDRYDDRVQITPKTTFTPEDTNNGFSWTQTVTVAGRVPKTVNQVTIVSKRIGA